MAYDEMVALKTTRQLVAMRRSLEVSIDDIGCFSANDPELLEAVEAELEKRKDETTEDYWQCKCEGFHLHPRDQDVCRKCGEHYEDSARSRIVEVEEEMQDLIGAIHCLKGDDVERVLENALLPEMKARLAELWS